MQNRIKALREDRDMRQSDLAKETGIDQRTISNYETGKSNPDSYALIKLADFFDVSIDYLVCRTNGNYYSNNDKKRAIEKIQMSLEHLKKSL
ncbi:MAG: helix-turn-helix transcriptional regulator [Clostridia bacterium]|nr:helix-turn-helix transcriptional regulator [Clostridia bacterium]